MPPHYTLSVDYVMDGVVDPALSVTYQVYKEAEDESRTVYLPQFELSAREIEQNAVV